MKKGLKFILLGFVWLAFVWSKPIAADAEEYYWSVPRDIEGAVGSWYEGGDANSVDSEKLDGMPEIVAGDSIYVCATLDEETKEWFKSLSGEAEFIKVLYENDFQIGTAETADSLSIYRLDVYYGTVSFYGNARTLGHTSGTVNFYGDTEKLELGDINPGKISGTINVTGNVGEVVWYPENDEFGGGFHGNVSVSGTVAEGDILDFVYEPVLDKYLWKIAKNIGACEAGVFRIEAGVLYETVPVTDAETEEVNYKIEYQLYNDYCYKQVHDIDTGVIVLMEKCELEEIKDGAIVTLYSSSQTESFVLDVDLAQLTVFANKGSQETASLIVNGDVAYMSVGTFQKSAYNVTVNGDVERLHINFRYQPNNNLKISGKVDECKAMEDYETIGYLTCENTQIIVDGNWNSSLYMKQSLEDDSQISYTINKKEDLNAALSNENIGEKVAVDDVVLIKDSKVGFEQTLQNVLTNLSESAGIKNVLEKIQQGIGEGITAVAEAVSAIDISVNTVYRNDETEELYSDDTYKSESISQLAEELEFSIKIPEIFYDENAEYTIVRHHVNEDGSVSDEALDTVQDEDTLTFASDKFSTFMVVKTTKTGDNSGEEDSQPTPTPEPTATPKPTTTPEPTVAPVVTPTVEPTQAPVVTPAPEADITVAQGEDGNWYSTVNGVLDPNYTGLAQLGEAWWMVVNGKIDFTYTSPVFFDDNWWFVRDGLVEFDYNGLVFVNDDWWYVVNGRIDFSFNGLAFVNDAWWYVSSGRIDFSYTGLIYFSDNWWFVQNGCVNFGYTGLAFINDDWWYVVNGRIDFGYCGLFDYDNQKWYVQGGKIDFSYNNVYYFNDIWWYIETGKVNFQYNGLAYTQFNDKWWYVINGVISFDYTGAAYANEKYWYVERGEIDFQRNGKVTIDGVEKDVAWGEILM
ncbi:MAG: hypothetical protein E7287_00435 [Lachnospiraceae bacterium]|nr:hypothetical protein [Lachnospiraceae bacterium]